MPPTDSANPKVVRLRNVARVPFVPQRGEYLELFIAHGFVELVRHVVLVIVARLNGLDLRV